MFQSCTGVLALILVEQHITPTGIPFEIAHTIAIGAQNVSEVRGAERAYVHDMIGTLDDDFVDAQTLPGLVKTVIATAPPATACKCGVLVRHDAHAPARRIRSSMTFPLCPNFRRCHRFIAGT